MLSAAAVVVEPLTEQEQEDGVHIHNYRNSAEYLTDLQERMAAAGVTQTDIAEKMGVHIQHISRLFSGRVANPRFQTIIDLERAFRQLSKR